MSHVKRMLTVSAEPEDVWAVIGAFDGLPDWHPVVAKSETSSEGGDTIRVLTTADGAVLSEKLLAHSDDDRSYSYSITESPLPVKNYRATIVVDDAEGGSTVHWWSDFDPDGVSGEEAEAVIASIYEAGFEALKERFG